MLHTDWHLQTVRKIESCYAAMLLEDLLQRLECGGSVQHRSGVQEPYLHLIAKLFAHITCSSLISPTNPDVQATGPG